MRLPIHAVESQPGQSMLATAAAIIKTGTQKATSRGIIERANEKGHRSPVGAYSCGGRLVELPARSQWLLVYHPTPLTRRSSSAARARWHLPPELELGAFNPLRRPVRSAVLTPRTCAHLTPDQRIRSAWGPASLSKRVATNQMRGTPIFSSPSGPPLVLDRARTGEREEKRMKYEDAGQ